MSPEPDVLPETVVLTNIVFFQEHNVVRGWAVGEDGLMIKSVYSGETWFVQQSLTSEDLRGLDFVDEATGWIVGRNGTIHKTIDGRTTWEE